MLRGEAGVEEALAAAQAKADAFLDCLGERTNPGDWDLDEACAQQVDPGYAPLEQ